MVKRNACIFISGKGSNLKNLINRSRDYNFPISIKLVVSNKKEALGIQYAKKNFIPYLIVDTQSRNFESKLLIDLKKHNISLICLAGYMKILSKKFLRDFGKRVINIHPSLLPKFKGLKTFAKIIKNKEKKTGCTVHFVDEKLDNGKIISQRFFFIDPTDNEDKIRDRTQKLEYLLFPESIIKIFQNR